MISDKYAWHVCFLLSIVLYPTVSNFYMGLPSVKNKISTEIPVVLDGAMGTQTNRNRSSIDSVFSTDDWVEMEYLLDSGETITLFAARGYDGRPFLHFPERGLFKQTWSDRTHTIQRMGGGKQSAMAHYLTLTGAVETKKAIYCLLHGNKTIANPYLYLLGRIPFILFGDRPEFTLLFVSSNDERSDPGMEKVLESLLCRVSKNACITQTTAP